MKLFMGENRIKLTVVLLIMLMFSLVQPVFAAIDYEELTLSPTLTTDKQVYTTGDNLDLTFNLGGIPEECQLYVFDYFFEFDRNKIELVDLTKDTAGNYNFSKNIETASDISSGQKIFQDSYQSSLAKNLLRIRYIYGSGIAKNTPFIKIKMKVKDSFTISEQTFVLRTFATPLLLQKPDKQYKYFLPVEGIKLSVGELIPSITPSITPSVTPSVVPTAVPTAIPTVVPTSIPTTIPTGLAATIKLIDSQGVGIAGGTVAYAGSSWLTAGNTDTNGILQLNLPLNTTNITVRLTYAGASKDISQNVKLDSVVTFQTVSTEIILKDSEEKPLIGGTVSYAGSTWKTVGNTDGNGIITKELLPVSYTFRMTYEGASKDISQNVGNGNNKVEFKTVKANISLKDSNGTPISNGAVSYAGSSWKTIGNTGSEGVITKELLPVSYTFRMTYAGASKDISQNINADKNIIFQTVNTKIVLRDSQGNSLSGGAVSYAGSTWQNIGVTEAQGFVLKELLPVSYTFRMTYEGASRDISQNVGTSNEVEFKTVKANIYLKASNETPISNGAVSYAGSSWKTIGNTGSEGVITKELLPVSYTFRMTYAGASKDISQNINTDKNIIFQTVNTKIVLQDSQGNSLSEGAVSYAGSIWQNIGVTEAQGFILKELLPVSYTFRMTYEGASKDISQNVGNNNEVVFKTVNASINLKASNGTPISNGAVSYAGSSWKTIGNTGSEGIITKELLPVSYTFRMTYAGTSMDIAQNIGTNSIIQFSTVSVIVKLLNSNGLPIQGGVVSYAGSTWQNIGVTNEKGEVIKELLPKSFTFRMSFAGVSKDKSQNVGTERNVVFAY